MENNMNLNEIEGMDKLSCALDYDGETFVFKNVEGGEPCREEDDTPSTYGSRIRQNAVDEMLGRFNKTPQPMIAIDFAKPIFKKLLSFKNLKGIRIYYGKRNITGKPDSEDFLSLIIVGYDKEGNDILIKDDKDILQENLLVAYEVGHGGGTKAELEKEGSEDKFNLAKNLIQKLKSSS